LGRKELKVASYTYQKLSTNTGKNRMLPARQPSGIDHPGASGFGLALHAELLAFSRLLCYTRGVGNVYDDGK
jgi:hypothetical protein